MPQENLNSPLSEAKPESLAELFMRDPLELTRQDRDKMVSVLRTQRVEFEKSDAEAKPRARKSAPKEKLPKGAKIEDLGF